jgi:hypothetical protein
MFGFVPKKKTLRLRADQIKPLAPNRGGCFASDMVTVDGQNVAFMYREPPDDATDSGWRFLSGLESQEYLDDPAHLSIYDVNTIANYDPEIIPLLDAAAGSAFERESGKGRFIEVDDFEPHE